MTTLTKPIKREIIFPGDAYPTIVTIDPETKRIYFRAKGCRSTYSYPLGAVRYAAVKDEQKEK